MSKVIAWFLGILVCLAGCVNGLAQVRSITLGIRTHCPYGIKGCWPEIRDGLERPAAIAEINGDPDARTDTCQVQMRNDWIPDPDMFAMNFRNMHIGVDVRGVEAVAEGALQKQGTNLVLALGVGDTAIQLAPLTQKVQWDPKRKRSIPPTRAERKAFQKLIRLNQASERVRVTGPFLKRPAEQADGEYQLILEVRKFEILEGS